MNKPDGHLVPKNLTEVLVISERSYHGRRLLDGRVHVVPVNPRGDYVRTKKGLSLRPETWRALVPEIEAALREMHGATTSQSESTET